MELARRYLQSRQQGLQIGASTLNPFPGVKAWNLDYIDVDVFNKAQETYEGSAERIDVVASADAMPFSAGSLSFILASHVLEHMVDTIQALCEWDRVLEVGGIAFLIVPHKERTFDAPRPRTPFEHLLADHAEKMTIARDSQVPSSHYHCWITADGVEMIERLNALGALDWEILEVEDVDSKVGNGFTLVARKRALAQGSEVPPDAPIAFHQWTLDLPFQVIGRTLQTIVLGPKCQAPQGLPAGRYRVTAVSTGFPPRAMSVQTIDVGAPLAIPQIHGVEVRGSDFAILGENFGPTTWLEAKFADGQIHSRLPRFQDGCLLIETAALLMSPEGMEVTPLNPAPGGGRGEARQLSLG